MTQPQPRTRFAHYPGRPVHDQPWNGYLILRNSHDAAGSFLDTFESVRQTRRARGAPTDEEQDLLRAMLSFASAGLDSMVKQLVRDCLADIVGAQEGAFENFRGFVEKRLARSSPIDQRFVASVLTHTNPRAKLVEELVAELTSFSLQSRDQLLRVASFFDVPSHTLCTDLVALKRIFDARNQIAHEMDIDFSQPNRNRRPRAKQRMIDDTNALFQVADNFLRAVDGRLP